MDFPAPVFVFYMHFAPSSGFVSQSKKMHIKGNKYFFCCILTGTFKYFSPLREDNVSYLPTFFNTYVCMYACVCAAIPSGPRNVISSVNETSLSLEWDEPEDTGGRSDLVYNVVCKKCLRDRSPCTRCDDNVDIAPRRLGLRQRKVVVRNLQAHTRYSFEVQAVNGVSGKKPTSPSYSTVNITTNQAGE